MTRRLALGHALLLAALLVCGTAQAQPVEIAPFVGYGFGGALVSTSLGRTFPVNSGIAFGGTVDIAIAETWRFEALYSRQDSDIGAPGSSARIGLHVERYLAGFQEEKAWGKVRAFGTILAGATRFAPSGYDSETFFTAGLTLGIKTRVAHHVGLRVEGRLFYVPVGTSGGAVCVNGQCLFGYSGTGMFQGDVSGGAVFGF
jgi:hypothetical protein